MPFAEFWGQWHKLYKELEDIGHPPSEEKCYEMLRRSVTNVNLRQFVIQLDLPPAVRLSIASFFEYYLYVTRTQKEFDTGHGNGKRKQEDETIVGRTVTLLKKSKTDANLEPICWRCGEAGHIRSSDIVMLREPDAMPRCVRYAIVILVEICTMRGCVAIAAIKFLPGGFSSLLSRVKERRIMLQVLSQREREEREILGRKKLPTTMVLGTIILLQLLLLLHLFLRSYSKREL